MSIEEQEHRASVEAVRRRREERLRDPEGWLSLVGLHWLHEGENRFGTDPAGEIPLAAQAGPLPALAGRITVNQGRATASAEPGAGVTVVDGPLPDGLELVDDTADEPTVLALGSLRFYLVRRGERLGIRVKDRAAPAIAAFGGLDYFPIDPRWQLAARLEPASPGTTIPVPDVLGDVDADDSPGDVAFELDGGIHRLHALEAQPGHLWLIFADATNGDETYGGGRFLVTGPLQPDNSVELDFNLTYNPPCVFSPYATCPLPPEGNRLALRVEAGEKMYRGDHEAPD
jgi:uncharacterized protein (DUF1684 family)